MTPMFWTAVEVADHEFGTGALDAAGDGVAIGGPSRRHIVNCPAALERVLLEEQLAGALQARLLCTAHDSVGGAFLEARGANPPQLLRHRDVNGVLVEEPAPVWLPWQPIDDVFGLKAVPAERPAMAGAGVG